MSIVSIIILIIASVFLIVFLIIRNFLSRIKYSQIVIFSEGNQYLNTFLPIVKELIKRMQLRELIKRAGELIKRVE